MHNRDPELTAWKRRAQQVLKDDDYAHDDRREGARGLPLALMKCVQHGWVKTLADLEGATAVTIEASMRASGVRLSKNPAADANDIASAIRYVIDKVPAVPAGRRCSAAHSGVHTGGAGSSGVRTADVRASGTLRQETHRRRELT